MDAATLATRAVDTSDPEQGLRSVAALRRLVETLELKQVEEALGRGLTWAAIAAALGVTRQAVHRKYARRIRRVGPRDGEVG